MPQARPGIAAERTACSRSYAIVLFGDVPLAYGDPADTFCTPELAFVRATISEHQTQL